MLKTTRSVNHGRPLHFHVSQKRTINTQDNFILSGLVRSTSEQFFISIFKQNINSKRLSVI